MGVPTFFLSIIRNKFYKNVHSGVENGKIKCDYFFLDYNGIVYGAYANIKKQFNNSMTKDEIEELIIGEVIRYTKYLICDVVKPQKLTYIALDGPAPRAKMVQQRSRRYKKYQEKILLQQEKNKYTIDNTDKVEWDESANISPGTVFMEKLSNKLIENIKAKNFNTHSPKMRMILSNSNVPGEGEHKFLPVIRSMREKDSTKKLNVYLYGKDADLIVLAISTHKTNMHVIREVQVETPEMKKLYENSEFIDVNIDNLRNAFNHDLTRTFKNYTFDKIRILNDYIFLTFLVGNDFVLSMPFLKINKDGLKTLVAIYHDIKINHSEYLVNYHPDKKDSPSINLPFFVDLIKEVAKKEDMFMKKQQYEVDKLMKGYKDNRRVNSEMMMTPFEIFSSRYTHLQVCSPDHPLYSEYFKDFKQIDYNKDYEEWKEDYYRYYYNVDKKNEEEYLQKRVDIVKNYLESLVFTLKYYFQGCPAWQWHYKFRTSPLLSDVVYVLENSLIKIDEIEFTIGSPYTPFQQLMLILPPQMNGLIPSVLRPIMLDDKLLCTQFYPTSFKMDVTTGIKTQYSEALLPEIDEDFLIDIVKKFEKKLSKEEKERNTIKEKPIISN
jgi:5'-3' exoribonuclease 2